MVQPQRCVRRVQDVRHHSPVFVSSYQCSNVIDVTRRTALAFRGFQRQGRSTTTETLRNSTGDFSMNGMPWNRVHWVMRRVSRWALPLVLMLLAAGCGVMRPSVRPDTSAPPPAASSGPPPVSAAVPAPQTATPPPAAAARAAPDASSAAPIEVTPRIDRINEGQPNAPYVINGERYVPHNQDVSMNQVGLASWYGKPFHGRKTANGETYNMHRMTAAHKTMPLPSYALVRHRGNGKEIIVRVNDRGPFIKGRVIDLSYAAAKALGIDGLGPVEVVRLTHEVIREGTWRTPSLMAARTSARQTALAAARLGRASTGKAVTVAAAQ